MFDTPCPGGAADPSRFAKTAALPQGQFVNCHGSIIVFDHVGQLLVSDELRRLHVGIQS